jgi:ribosomal 50S subunit-recycling heat shock protein
MAEQIGEVTDYFKHVKAAAIKLTSNLNVGDSIEIKGGEKDFKMKISSMQINRKPIQSAKKGDEIGVLVPEDVHKGYKVFRA